MQRDEVNKYDVLGATSSEETALDFKNMINNIGIEVAYYEYDTVAKSYKTAVNIKGVLFDVQDISEGIIDVVSEGNAIFSTDTFSDLGITPTEKDKVIYSSIEFLVRNTFFYGKNDKVSLLKDSIVVSMLLIERRKFTRNSF